MRMLMQVRVPNETFNAAIRKGTAQATMQQILEEIRPEAAYFTTEEGKRSALLVVDLPTAKSMCAMAEPWFLAFQAEVDFRPIMSAEDIAQADLAEIGKKWA
ncbi:MAG: panthothenate synthetase [Candidatus Schekmanbacteria bacterium]|nr:panthothenate synthetase [Candidatus Schekmanbacteria bacterium]